METTVNECCALKIETVNILLLFNLLPSADTYCLLTKFNLIISNMFNSHP